MPRRPLLREILQTLQTVIERLDEILQMPPLSQSARQAIAELRREVEHLLARNGRTR